MMNQPNEHLVPTAEQTLASDSNEHDATQRRSRRRLLTAIGGIGVGVVVAASIAGALITGHNNQDSEPKKNTAPTPNDKETSLSPVPTVTETSAAPESEAVPASVKKLDSDTLLTFETESNQDQLTWLTWAMRDLKPFADRFERVSGEDTDVLAPISEDNTGEEILARRAYFERYAYSLTKPDGSFDLDRAQKIMYASSYLQNNSGQATVLDIISTMEKNNVSVPVDTQALKGFVSTDNTVEKVGKLHRDDIDGVDKAEAKAVMFKEADGTEKQVIAYYVPATDYLGNKTTVFITSELLNPDEFAEY